MGMKTVLFTDESRALPNDPDGLTKWWVFNGDNSAVRILRKQYGSVVMSWGSVIRNEPTGLFRVLVSFNCPLTCIGRSCRSQLSHSLVIFIWPSWSIWSSCVVIFMHDTVSEENSLQDHHHAFLQQLYAQNFVPKCQTKFFNLSVTEGFLIRKRFFFWL